MFKKILYFLIFATFPLSSFGGIETEYKSLSKITLHIFPIVDIINIDDISLSYDTKKQGWQKEASLLFKVFSTVKNYNITASSQNPDNNGNFRAYNGKDDYIRYSIEWNDNKENSDPVILTSGKTEKGNKENSSPKSSVGEIKVKISEEDLNQKPIDGYNDILTIVISGI